MNKNSKTKPYQNKINNIKKKTNNYKTNSKKNNKNQI